MSRKEDFLKRIIFLMVISLIVTTLLIPTGTEKAGLQLKVPVDYARAKVNLLFGLSR